MENLSVTKIISLMRRYNELARLDYIHYCLMIYRLRGQEDYVKQIIDELPSDFDQKKVDTEMEAIRETFRKNKE